MNLKNKVALITGGAQGIGKATSLVLASYGANVVVADLQIQCAQQTAEEAKKMGNKACAVYIDVTKKDSIAEAVEKTVNEFGKIDILVNAAGIAIASNFETLEEDLWDRTFNINAKGTFLCCQAVTPHLKKNNYGKIINLSSRTAKVGEAGNGVYCCSKAAQSMFTQVLALELAPFNINVNAVCPGLVDTEMIEKAVINIARERNLDPEEFRKSWIDEIPLKRMARTEEIGEVIAFLASDKSDYITGASININGGTTMV